MADTVQERTRPEIHPLHAFLLAGAFPLFLAALLSDLGYGSTAEPQWSNFAAWLLLGAMVFTGFALLWSMIDMLRSRWRRTWRILCFALLLATFVLGLIDNFVHARDAWAIMPAGPILSAILTLLALAASWAGLSSWRRGEVA